MTDYDIDGCRYIIGELKSDKPWHYCEAPRKPGSSYCAPHHAACYYRLRRRRHVEKVEIARLYPTDTLDDAA